MAALRLANPAAPNIQHVARQQGHDDAKVVAEATELREQRQRKGEARRPGRVTQAMPTFAAGIIAIQ